MEMVLVTPSIVFILTSFSLLSCSKDTTLCAPPCIQLPTSVNVPPWNSHVSTLPSELMNDTFSPIFLSSGGTKTTFQGKK
nr:MAG TPA: PLAT/LH2 and C2-like Ca2+-binding lipoprotein [Caudoviricetes sp.]